MVKAVCQNCEEEYDKSVKTCQKCTSRTFLVGEVDRQKWQSG